VISSHDRSSSWQLADEIVEISRNPTTRFSGTTVLKRFPLSTLSREIAGIKIEKAGNSLFAIDDDTYEEAAALAKGQGPDRPSGMRARENREMDEEAPQRHNQASVNPRRVVLEIIAKAVLFSRASSSFPTSHASHRNPPIPPIPPSLSPSNHYRPFAGRGASSFVFPLLLLLFHNYLFSTSCRALPLRCSVPIISSVVSVNSATYANGRLISSEYNCESYRHCCAVERASRSPNRAFNAHGPSTDRLLDQVPLYKRALGYLRERDIPHAPTNYLPYDAVSCLQNL